MTDDSKHDASRWRIMMLHLRPDQARQTTQLVDALREQLAIELGCDANGDPVDPDGVQRARIDALLASTRTH